MSREEVYATLAQAYRYDANQIALMTPYQQISLYSPKSVADVITFDTLDEYQKWLAANGKRQR